MSTIRLNAFLASATGCSRRQADADIASGFVRVNDQRGEVGQQVDPATARVTVRGRPVMVPTAHTYVALNKPVGYVCTRSDPQGRPTIYDLLPAELHRCKPVGRLDYDSEGLILLSDDGDFINQMTHPRYEHEREYEVRFSLPITSDLLRQWQHGVPLEEGLAKVDSIEQVDERTVRLVLHQGWNRQLRRMAGVLGLAIGRLRRIRVGNIALGKLQSGSHRLLPPPQPLVR